MATPPTNWPLMERVQAIGRRVLYYGPPGTGKSTSAQAGRADSDIIRVSLHDEFTVAELLGHFVPVGDRFIWLDGPALVAWRFGKRLVIDEIDLASGAVLSACRALLDDERVAKLTIPNPAMAGMTDEEVAEAIVAGQGHETLKPAAGFQVIGTMNGDPDDLDGPLRERFDAKFYVGEPHPNAIAALPEGLRETAKRTATENDEQRRISVRTWFSFVDLTAHVGFKDAAFAVFGVRAGDVLDGLRLGGVNLDETFPEAPGSKPRVRPVTATATTAEAATDGTTKDKVFAAVLAGSWGDTPPKIAKRAGITAKTARVYLLELLAEGLVVEMGAGTKRYVLSPEGKARREREEAK